MPVPSAGADPAGAADSVKLPRCGWKPPPSFNPKRPPKLSRASTPFAPGCRASNAAPRATYRRRSAQPAPRGRLERAGAAQAEHGWPSGRTSGARARVRRVTDLQAAIQYASRHGSGSCGPARHCRGRRTRSPASLRGPEACGNHSAVSRASRCDPEQPAHGAL